jgi:hypothetical protein
MASTISAGTTSGTAIAIAGDTTGNLAFQTSNGTYTQTMPNATGTVMVSGNMPAFSAYKTSSQSYSANTWTKITYDTEEYDTNSNFASSTFTPTVAGYYLFTARNQLIADGTAMSEMNSAFYKNGSIAKSGAYKYQPAAATAQFGSNISAVIYCNGSTDYVECYARTDGSTLTIFGSASVGATNSYFQGTLQRTA